MTDDDRHDTQIGDGASRMALPGPPAGDSFEGSVVADRYLVHRLIGSGGMGAVYEAEHIHMQKRVALKILHGAMSVNPEVVARFEREAVAAGRIAHPSVVTATDFGQLSSGVFYLALEYVEGESLAQLLDREKTLKPDRAFRIVAQITAALVAAHEAGIVHRDLKPENVMLVATSDEEDFVKVLDFGIAKLHSGHVREGEEGLTRVGMVFGTPEYMSPEQARGAVVDARSDLYSLGMIFYEMLVGHTAFAGDDLMAVLTAQMADAPPALSDDLPLEIRQLVARLLEKETERRPQTADLLAEELVLVADKLSYFMPLARTSAGTRLDRTGSGFRTSGADLVEFLPGVPRRVLLNPLASLRALSIRPVSIGPRSVPLWLPALALLGGMLIGTFVMLKKTLEVAAARPEPAAAEDPTEQVEIEARGGDRDALGELRRLIEVERIRNQQASQNGKRPGVDGAEAARESARFMALGRGYSVIRHYSASMAAYQSAVQADPHVAEDPELLLDVRVALEQRDAMESGIDFAKDHLGAQGADLIFDVWRDFRGRSGMTPVVAHALKLIRGKELREHAAPPLQIALDLERAQTCADYKEILPRAVALADDRSLMKLEALRTRKGCGSFKNSDCFGCLRASDVPLERAIESAKKRSSPEFLNPLHDESSKK